MLCVAVNNRDSLDMIKSFKNEIRVVNLTAPVLLVGTKNDVRETEEDCLTMQDLEKESKEYKFLDTMETSSKNWQEGSVKKAFNKAIDIAIN